MLVHVVSTATSAGEIVTPMITWAWDRGLYSKIFTTGKWKMHPQQIVLGWGCSQLAGMVFLRCRVSLSFRYIELMCYVVAEMSFWEQEMSILCYGKQMRLCRIISSERFYFSSLRLIKKKNTPHISFSMSGINVDVPNLFFGYFFLWIFQIYFLDISVTGCESSKACWGCCWSGHAF